MVLTGGCLEGETDKSGLPVVQGQKDCTLGTRGEMGKMRREGPREVLDMGDLGMARGLVMQLVKARGY